MTNTPLQLMPETADSDVWRYFNPLARRFLGIDTGGVILRGDLGTRRDLVDPNTETSGHYTLESQSLATGGLHAAFPLSTTATTAAPTTANSAVLINDDGLSVGTGASLDAEAIRVYEPGRVDYSELTSLNGELLVGGSGASAGGMATGIHRLLAGAASRWYNAGNTLYGQVVADANGNLVTGGSGGAAIGTLTVGGHLTLPLAAGARITGDLSNATVASRLIFQTATANGISLVSAMPLGTGASAGFAAYNTSAPATSTVEGLFQATATALEVRANSPAASYLPLQFYANNVLALALVPSGTAIRVQSDFSNGTHANRTMVQTATANASTNLGILPNGTGVIGGVLLHNTSSAGVSGFLHVYATTAQTALNSGALGGATAQPMKLQFNGTTRIEIDATGIGLLGATPVGAYALPADGTDPASVQTLVNEIKQLLIDVGLGT